MSKEQNKPDAHTHKVSYRLHEDEHIKALRYRSGISHGTSPSRVKHNWKDLCLLL